MRAADAGVARVVSILAALWKAVRRGGKRAGSFASNNLFVVSVALLFFKDPGGFLSLNVLIGLVLFFPLSADPLRKIPPARLGLWPLERGERGLLRVLSLWLNPVACVLAAVAFRRTVTWGLWAAMAALFAVAFIAPRVPRGGPYSLLPGMPHFPGVLDQLIRKNLRASLTTLDFYCALAIATAGCGFRAAGLLPREAFLPMSIGVILALSTCAANLFGLDGEQGMMRYRLLPLAGWQVLAAKDAAFLLVALVLTAPLSPAGGMAAAITALAYGHYASVMRRHPDTRWRFSTTTSAVGGLLQVVVMATAAAGVVNGSVLVLLPCAAAYAWSTWYWGKALMRETAIAG